MRVIPPEQTATVATEIDEQLVAATCALMGIEDLPEPQRDLLTVPANRGGWGLPALETTNECDFI